MVDAFPSFESTAVRVVRHPETKKGFRKIFDSHKLLISKAYLEDDKVFFDPIEHRHDNLISNFYRTGKESFTRWENYDSISWDAVANRLKLERHGKKNTDIRVSFRYDNTFLVKQYFTFGQRVVEPGTCHVYQTTTVPLFFYVLATNKRSSEVLRRNRGFRAADQFLYRHYVLEPESKYRVPEGTRYVLVAAQKTLFSVDVVRADLRLPFECRDCRETTKLKRKRDIYDKVPATPALDRLDDELVPPPSKVYHVFQPQVIVEPPQVTVEPQVFVEPPQVMVEPQVFEPVLYVMPQFAEKYNELRNRELGPPIPRDYVQTAGHVPEPMDLSTMADFFAWLQEPQTPNVINTSENIDELFKNLESCVVPLDFQ